MVANNLVSNALGTINPVEKLAAWAHEQGAIMVVDAAQAAPHRAIDVQALGCDFIAISSHKLCGPSGVGALWGKPELLEQMQPFNLGGEMIRSVALDRTSWNELPYKFEAGTPAIAEAYGFGAAIDYLSEIGLGAIEAHEHELTEYALARLGELRLGARVRPSRRPARRHRLVRGRGHPPARRRSDPRLGGCRRARGPPLHAAAHVAPRRLGDDPRQLLPLHDPRGDRPAGRRPAQGQEESRLMSEFDQLYREVILDHYKNPRSHGLLDAPDAQAEGQNPLCGDEITVSLRFDGDTIADVGFEGRGCAISQAATSMLTEIVVGRNADDVARMPKEELLEEIGIPLTPVRLKCAILGLGVLKVALHKSKGTPLPDEWTQGDDLTISW